MKKVKRMQTNQENHSAKVKEAQRLIEIPFLLSITI